MVTDIRIRSCYHKRKTLTGIRYGKKALDPDNLIGSLKPVIDALVWAEGFD